ncbi:hypothetical protein TorRG33x02_213200 [Trema orientale]|uniref:Uncharacterized protein n=1 Tax=Trema orientale TaxID=63057 RepID=A0A2P5EBJ7_TREOI|nr:hypothetical protein TorRG33x02_213200 [Trema orientale]
MNIRQCPNLVPLSTNGKHPTSVLLLRKYSKAAHSYQHFEVQAQLADQRPTHLALYRNVAYRPQVEHPMHQHEARQALNSEAHKLFSTYLNG